jgi:phosphoribosylaminoimidazolecarboxamide formyltransferase/IMP cyclohydrolase
MYEPRIQRALVSVSDKSGLVEFARRLLAAGVEIYSTGGTRRHLEAADIAVHDVAQYTGFPEMMDGRVKTLHPKVFAGILCRRDRPDDMTALDEHDIVPFELVVVNLYPFEATVARAEVSLAEAVEQIDIGGPSLVRAAAKNHRFTTVVTDPQQYDTVAAQIEQAQQTTLELRQHLAAEAFAHTARYDAAIAAFFAQRYGTAEALPRYWPLVLQRHAPLRYGENPHQAAAVYRVSGSSVGGLLSARQVHGKELSYNNLLDLDSALNIVRGWDAPCVAVIKHNNPCGAAAANVLAEAARAALAGDPVSAFGSIVALNRAVDAATAEVLTAPGQFIEAVAAPQFDDEALRVLTTRPTWRESVRLLQTGPLKPLGPQRELRAISGGYLVQEADVLPDDVAAWRVVTDVRPSDEQYQQLRFAWWVVRHVKSNAIVLVSEGALLGVGAGQMSRIDSVHIALQKAGERARGSVMASDAFFPFADSIEAAAAAGVAAVVQPGGSRRDAEVIAACNRHGLPMVFTGRRHFRH